jgi:hypothetical protein
MIDYCGIVIVETILIRLILNVYMTSSLSCACPAEWQEERVGVRVIGHEEQE